MQISWIQDGRIWDGCHHEVTWEGMSLSHIEILRFRSQSGVRVFLSEVWVKNNKSVWIQWWQCLNSIRVRIQDGCHHQVESESMSDSFLCKMAGEGNVSQVFFCAEWWEPFLASVSESWGITKMVESKMAKLKMAAIIKLRENEVDSEWMSEVFFVENGWMQDGRIKDGCHHQVDSEWMMEVSFLQIVGTNISKC